MTDKSHPGTVDDMSNMIGHEDNDEEQGEECELCGEDHELRHCDQEYCDGCGEVVDNCVNSSVDCGDDDCTTRACDFATDQERDAWMARGFMATGFDALEDEDGGV